MLGLVDPRNVIYTKTGLRMPLTDRYSRRPPYRKKFTRTAKCFIGRCPGTENWTAAELNQVVFSYESRFNLRSDDNRVRVVWRPRAERLNLAFDLTTTHHSHSWCDGMGCCSCIQYTVTPSIDPWRHDSPEVCPWHPETLCVALMQRFPGAIFQQDNARPHTARVSQEFLRTVTTLPWLALSPDLYPIKHIWDHLGWRVGHPTSLIELKARLQQIWNEMSQESYRTCML
ncbi:transposable element Tcb2 transposase [Trichonephila clavipes]|nr:transposable element Tcb2 transposase [Trichonephila clavipes]